MTIEQKCEMLKNFLKITSDSSDYELFVCLDFAKREILNWLYSSYQKVPDDVTEVPDKYATIQVMACVVGYSLSGVEGQTSHTEGGISRTFKHDDMVAYIRSRITPFLGVY